jgi:hypothetical protein
MHDFACADTFAHLRGNAQMKIAISTNLAKGPTKTFD